MVFKTFKRGSKRLGGITGRGIKKAGSDIRTNIKESRERSKEEKRIFRESFREAKLSAIRSEARLQARTKTREKFRTKSKPLSINDGLFGNDDSQNFLFGSSGSRRKKPKRRKFKKQAGKKTVTFTIG